MSILVFIRELSFRLTKVLDSQLETIMTAIYALMTNTKNKALRKEAIYTLRTLSKYSSDIKMLYFITLMPKQMFTKFKLANTYCISFILQKDNLNILVFEESLLVSLVKIAAELFADAHQTINDLGEGILVDLFKRFVDRKKAEVCLQMLRDNVSKKRAEQILKFLRLHFEDIEEIIKVSRGMQAVEAEAVGRPISGSLFGRNAMTSLDVGGTVLDKYRDEKPMSEIAPRIHRKRNIMEKDSAPISRRDHELQEKLMDEIHQLLGG